MRRDLQPIIDARGGDEPEPLEDVFYTVSFDSMGGSEVDSQLVLAGEKAVKPPDPVYDGFGFYDWYKEAELINLWNFDIDVVMQDITLYARWIENSVIVTVDIEQIMNEAPILGSFTISRSGTGYDQKAIVKIDASEFDAGSIKWEIAGVGVYTVISGSGAEFELDATDVRYNTLGRHILKLEVKKNGITYRVNIEFTIVE